MREGEFPDLTPDLLGDVVISMDTAAREVQVASMSMERRFNELLVHGILHLMGYDHETSEKDSRVMEEKSREILALIYKNDPIKRKIRSTPDPIKLVETRNKI